MSSAKEGARSAWCDTASRAPFAPWRPTRFVGKAGSMATARWLGLALAFGASSAHAGPVPVEPVPSDSSAFEVPTTELSAPTPPEPTIHSLRVEATLEDDVMRGVARFEVEGTGTPLRLWLLTDRNAVAPSAMDQRSSRWIFPRERDLAPTRAAVFVDGVAVAAEPRYEPVGSPRGRDVAGSDLIVPVAPGPHRVVVRFRYRLPERFGRLGRIGDRVTLSAPWYPVPLRGGVVTEDLEHEITLDHDRDLVALAPGPRGAVVTAGVLRRRRTGAFVPVMLAPRLHRVERALPGGRSLVVVSPEALAEPPGPDASGVFALRDLNEVYALEQLERLATDVARTLALVEEAGCESLEPAPFVVAFAPSRTELAANAPGLALLSDRAFEIFPHEVARGFHDRAVRRALFRDALARCETSRVEPLEDRTWALDVRAALLTDLDEMRRRGRARSARELLGWAGFHPAIDQLLYAPQTAFPDVYFSGNAEPDPFREDPSYARSPRSRGRRILSMARDALGETRHRAWTTALLERHETARAALTRIAPEEAEHLDDWLAAAGTEVNYRLVDVQSEELPDGRFLHRVRVRREGDVRHEPVEVQVNTRRGSASGRWDGHGEEGVVEVVTGMPARDVRIDPRGRLVQSAEVAQDHPLADDATSHPFRPPVFQGFNLAYGATEQALIGFIDVALRRQYVTDSTFALRASTDPRSTGGLLRWVRGLGRARDTNARRGFLAPGVTFDRLHAGFAGEGSAGGWRAGMQIVGGYSSLRWFLDPRAGGSFSASLGTSVAFRDDDTRSYTVNAGARGNLTLPLGLRGVLVLVAGASGVLGDPLPGERPGLGGRFLLRAYQNGEVLGRARGFAVAELRFTPTALSDLSWNLLHLAWVRELQLALFTGAGVVFRATDGRDIAPGAEVGAGVRVHFDYGGVQPAVLALDVAVPLVRAELASDTLAPFTTLLAFEQYF